MVATVIAGRELLPVNARYFVLFSMVCVVNDTVDTGVGYIVSGLKNIANFGHFPVLWGLGIRHTRRIGFREIVYSLGTIATFCTWVCQRDNFVYFLRVFNHFR